MNLLLLRRNRKQAKPTPKKQEKVAPKKVAPKKEQPKKNDKKDKE